MKEDKKLTVYYDQECPLCSREISFIKSKNGSNDIEFIDINTAKSCDLPEGKSKSELMNKIHAVNKSLQIITGVEVFREIYHTIGYHKMVRITRLPVMRHILDFAYTIFAKYRIKIGSFFK